MKEILKGEFDGFVTRAALMRALGLSKGGILPVAFYMKDVEYIKVCGIKYYVRSTVIDAANKRKEWKANNKIVSENLKKNKKLHGKDNI